MVWIFLIVIVYLVILYSQTKKKLDRQEVIKDHYLKMLLLSTRNEEEYFKLLLRKYMIDSHLYYPLEEFNNLWIAISDDVEAWTVGSNFIKEKEKVVAPDITEAVARNTFNNMVNKEFIARAKMLTGWDNKDSVGVIKKAVRYQKHSYLGEALSEEEVEASKVRLGEK
jgi:hypothetical protein